jgi:hypothetical protein
MRPHSRSKKLDEESITVRGMFMGGNRTENKPGAQDGWDSTHVLEGRGLIWPMPQQYLTVTLLVVTV